MSRVFWLAMGVTAGAVVARKVNRAVDAISPQSVAGNLVESLAILGEGVRDFVEDVRDGMGERERVLSASLGLPEGEGRRLVCLPSAQDAGQAHREAIEGPPTDPQQRGT